MVPVALATANSAFVAPLNVTVNVSASTSSSAASSVICTSMVCESVTPGANVSTPLAPV